MPGVPGGIERHVEELYPRLVRLGVDVTVYARREYVTDSQVVDGVNVIALPSYGGRNGEALSHTALSLLHASRGGFDLLHVHAMGPGVLLPLAHALRLRPTVLTFHSFDYKRSKWGPGARAFLRLSEYVSIKSADALIAVSEAGTAHIRQRYHRSVRHIPNGPGRLEWRPPGPTLAELGLKPGRYVLAVGRLSPEKCLEDLIVAHAAALPETHLVLVGDTSFTDTYIARLRDIAGPSVLFPGYLHGPPLEELYSSALIFAIPSEIEGVSLSLLEAMSLRCAVAASDIPGNREALGLPPAGVLFPARDPKSLSAALSRLAEDGALRERLGVAAAARVREEFDWDTIAEATLAVYEAALSARTRSARAFQPRV
jgi:glycosyltransferase involved in cell wall biosynthesis